MGNPERHTPCQPFLDEFGDVLTPDAAADAASLLATDTSYRDRIVGSVVSTIIVANSRYDDNSPAEAAAVAVDCQGCILHGGCLAEKGLAERAYYERIERIVDMFYEGGPWLRRARLDALGLNEARLQEILTDAQLGRGLVDGKSPLDQLLGGVRNRRLKNFHRDELPEGLKGLKFVEHVESFPTELLERDDKDYAVQVIDMTANNGYRGIKPNEEEFGVLINRFLGTTWATDDQGRPQILGGALQKVVRVFDDGVVSEFRMGGKSRLYVGVSFVIVETADVSGKKTYRVFLIGWHGDSESAQEDLYRDTGLWKMRKPGESEKAWRSRTKG